MAIVEAPFPSLDTLGVPAEISSSKIVVLKFGGTSVASVENWQNIASLLRTRLADGLSIVVVHSALAGVSDLLDDLLSATESGSGDQLLEDIVARHERLAIAMELDLDRLLATELDELKQLTAGAKLVREVSPRVRARVMALGELMSTKLSAAWLTAQGLTVEWVDARSWLKAEDAQSRPDEQRYLNAKCPSEMDTELQSEVLASASIKLTQGFIAANSAGETVLLGRGGSDTSAAYLAARLAAQRLEIWSDVPGVFSADPHLVDGTRLLGALDYQEAQEIASTGGSVLHPRAIAPVRRAAIPVFLRCTSRPQVAGTTITSTTPDDSPVVKAVSIQTPVTLISMEGIAMWQEAGFLGRVFAVFAEFDVSVDLVSTSESNVTVSLEAGGEPSDETLRALQRKLEQYCRVNVLRDCAAISLVGRRIRAILHKIGPAFGVFEEERVYLLSQAANDLNFSFVVDEENGYRIVKRLHQMLVQANSAKNVFGLTWEAFNGGETAEVNKTKPWWHHARPDLLALMDDRDHGYIYNLRMVREAAKRLTTMKAVDRVYFAMKANNNEDVLRELERHGVNFECVSPGEIQRILQLFPEIDRNRLLFTPNFAAADEYEFGFAQQTIVTLDNLNPLLTWPEVFRDREVFVRLDPGVGRGHHEHVKTAGIHAKFGIPLFELDALQQAAAGVNCRIVGIHAHSGSGILDAGNWENVAETLSQAAQKFPDVRVLDLGGGLGVPERDEDKALDIAELDRRLGTLKEVVGSYDFWLEPGRYLVAEAGVLLARVNQIKGKGEKAFVGIATGMNSLIRPALYGAFHEIVNLSALDQPVSELVTVVGPICESADKLGTDRLLPPTNPGDILLIGNAGAYGRVMASEYNLREPAGEITLDV